MRYIPNDHRIGAMHFLVAAAQHSVFVMAYNVSAPRRLDAHAYLSFWLLLKSLPAKQIDCRMILPHLTYAHNLPPPEYASLSDLAYAGWKMRRTNSAALQHAKNWSLDGSSAIITSANLSETALMNNNEDMIVLTGSIESAPVRLNFMTHWKKATDWIPA